MRRKRITPPRTTQKNNINGIITSLTRTTVRTIPAAGAGTIITNAANTRGPQRVHNDAAFTVDSSIVIELKSLLAAKTIKRKGGAADEVAN